MRPSLSPALKVLNLSRGLGSCTFPKVTGLPVTKVQGRGHRAQGSSAPLSRITKLGYLAIHFWEELGA